MSLKRPSSNETTTKHRTRLIDDGIPLTPRSESSIIKKVSLTRSKSSPYLTAIDFAQTRAFKIYYVLIIIIIRLSFSLVEYSISAYIDIWPGTSITLVNMIHTCVTFYIFHWHRGGAQPFDASYDSNNFWELLDHGKVWSLTRKFYISIPVLLLCVMCYLSFVHLFLCVFRFLRASYECEWRKRYYVANLIALIVAEVPKMPFIVGRTIKVYGYRIL